MSEAPGKSWRTPAKHQLMDGILGSEVGATHALIRTRKGDVRRLVWYDLTAGDGIASDDADSWEKGCSPGILARHAKRSGVPVIVELHEIADANYDRLLTSLETHLPHLGYEHRAADTWSYRDTVTLVAHNTSGHLARTDFLTSHDAVFVLNDPNAITTWAMRDSFAEEISKRTWLFRSLSTMGCNAAGLKRLDPNDRLSWFDLVDTQQAALPGYRDLLLAAIHNDKAQWAYLISTSERWRGKTEDVVRTAFRKHGRTVAMSWYRSNPEAFQDTKLRLFLTHPELARIRGDEAAWLAASRPERLARIAGPDMPDEPEEMALFSLNDLMKEGAA